MALSGFEGRTTGAVHIPRVLSSYIVEFLEKNLQAKNFVTNRTVDVAANGQTVDFPVQVSFTVYQYADGDKLTDNLGANTDTKVSLTVSEMPMRPFLILDSWSMERKNDTTAMELKNAGYVVAKYMDTTILAETLDFSVNTIVNGGDPGTALTNIDLTAAQYTLDALDVPEDERAWFFHPIVIKDLMDLTGNYFTSMDFSESKALVRGQLSKMLLGSPVIKTTNVPTGTAGSPSATYYKNSYFHKSAIGLAMQKEIQYQTEYSVEWQGTLHNARSKFGTTTLAGTRGVLLYR
jgi:hypothetical protein